MNLIEVACSDKQGNLFGMVFANKHVQCVPGKKVKPLRSFELKVHILEQNFGWQIVTVDEKEFNNLERDKKVREAYIERLLADNQFTKKEAEEEEAEEEVKTSRGRRVVRK